MRTNFLGTQYSEVDWQIAAFIANGVRLAMFQPPWNTQDTTRDYALVGIPQVSRDGLVDIPIAAAWAKPYLDLTWGSAMGSSFTLRVQPIDPAFRGPQGEYLCGKLETYVPPPPAPQDATATGAAIAGSGIDVGLSGAGGQLFLTGVPGVVNLSTAEAAVAVVITAAVMHVEFTTPVSPGDIIDWPGSAGYFLNPSGGALTAWNITL